MASANLELVQSISEAWARGDFSASDWAAPEIEFEIVGGPAPGRWIGLAGMAAGWRDFLSVWEGWQYSPQDYRELDDRRVLAFGRVRGRGKRSGVPFEDSEAPTNLFHIDAGKITRFVIYLDKSSETRELRRL